MQQANKQIILKNSVFLYFRMLIVMAIALFTTRIVLQALGSTDYGLYDVVGGIVSIFVYVRSTLSASSSRFFCYEIGKHDKGDVAEVFRATFAIHFFFGIIFLLLVETVGLCFVNYILVIPSERLYACNMVLQAIAVTSMMSLMQIPYNALIIAQERMGAYAFISITNSLLSLVVALIVKYAICDRLILFAVLQMLVGIITFAVYISYCKRTYSLCCKIGLRFKSRDLKQILSFVAWNLLGSTSSILRVHGVNILINVFFGPVLNAANAISVQAGRLVRSFCDNFTTALKPQITKSYASGELTTVKRILYHGGKMSFILMILICYPLLFEIHYVLSLWLGDFPPFTAILVKLAIVVAIIEVFNQTLESAIQATGRIKSYQMVTSTVLLMILPITYIVYYLGYPVYWSYLVSVVITGLALLIRVYFVKKQVGISFHNYIVNVIMRCALAGLLSLIIPYALIASMSEGFLRLMTVSFMTTISTLTITYWLCLDGIERHLSNEFISKAVLSRMKRSEC